MSNDYELPPMPEPAGPDVGWFTEDQMREYALLAVQRERERCTQVFQYWLGNGADDRFASQCLAAIRKG
jgi:hypothetical protein